MNVFSVWDKLMKMIYFIFISSAIILSHLLVIFLYVVDSRAARGQGQRASEFQGSGYNLWDGRGWWCVPGHQTFHVRCSSRQVASLLPVESVSLPQCWGPCRQPGQRTAEGWEISGSETQADKGPVLLQCKPRLLLHVCRSATAWGEPRPRLGRQWKVFVIKQRSNSPNDWPPRDEKTERLFSSSQWKTLPHGRRQLWVEISHLLKVSLVLEFQSWRSIVVSTENQKLVRLGFLKPHSSEILALYKLLLTYLLNWTIHCLEFSFKCNMVV